MPSTSSTRCTGTCRAGPQRRPRRDRRLGADALKLSVGAALGVKVDYYVLINLQGFTKLINALGGIRVNVNTYIPIGGDSDRASHRPEQAHRAGANQKLNGARRCGSPAAATAPTTTPGWNGSAVWSTRSSSRPTRPTC